MTRSLFLIAAFSGLLGVTQGVNEFLLLFLRQNSGSELIPAIIENLTARQIVLPLFLWMLGGLAIAFILTLLLCQIKKLSLVRSLQELSRPYLVLSIPVGLSIGCVLSLWISPVYPYGSNLIVSLCLEGTFSELLTVLLFLSVLVQSLVRLLGWWQVRIPAIIYIVVAMIFFSMATPDRFYSQGVGQGNMFKYLRMAATVSGTGTLNIERAEENTNPTFSEFVSFVPKWISAYVVNSVDFFTGKDLMPKASRVNRSMFRGVNGGLYYINAPGPGILLVPAYLFDKSLNRWFGKDLQISVILFWQFLGALLVFEIMSSVEKITSRSTAAIVSFAIALSVPFLFYTFQIYPELPGGLLILFAFRKIVINSSFSRLEIFTASLALAVLPWLHQKYSVVAAVLGLFAVAKLKRSVSKETSTLCYKLVLLCVPLVASAYSIFLYNYVLTGSWTPTATFEAAGRSSFEPWNVFTGFSGLLFDRDNGLFIFAPLYVLSLVGLRPLFSRHRHLFTPFVLVLFSYLVVIASFPYWPGAVSTMGRYILSVLPLLSLPMALLVERALSSGLFAGIFLTMLSASLAYSLSFVRDIIPSYQPRLFWDRTLYSDPVQYLASFTSEGLSNLDGARYTKYILAILCIGFLIYLMRSCFSTNQLSPNTESKEFHRKVCVGSSQVLLMVVTVGVVLEYWPTNLSEKDRPVFRNVLDLSDERKLSVYGKHGFEGSGVWVSGSGSTTFLLQATEPLLSVKLRFVNGPKENTIVFRERKQVLRSILLPARGPHTRTFRLRNPYQFNGVKGTSYLYRFTVSSQESFIPAENGVTDDDRQLGVYVRLL